MIPRVQRLPCNIDMADEGIRSTFFRGYICMVDVLAFLILWMSRWYDACPCHSDEINAADMSDWRRRSRLRERVCGNCVMNARRGPEMASGCMMEFLRKLLDVGVSVILCELAQIGLDQSDTGAILHEFIQARRHIWLTMVVKHSYWCYEPWAFFGLGHLNVGIARACARRCVRMRGRLLAQPGKPIHRLTKLMLFNDTMWDELNRFASGCDMEALKNLVIFAAIFRFAFTSELVFE